MPENHGSGGDHPGARIVVGGGPAGLTAAITLAAGGLATVLVGKRPARPDNRTTALLAGSVTALSTLGVWELCAAQAAPLKVMRIVDDTGRLWRAPEVKFAAGEIDLEAFGYNIENRHLVAALEQRARALTNLRMIEDEVLSVEPGDDAVTVDAQERRPLAARRWSSAPMAAARFAAPPPASRSTSAIIRKVALTVCLKHSRPHRDTSTEFHTAERAVHAGAAAGPALEPGLGARSDARRRDRRARRRRAFRRDRTRLAFDPRQDRGRAGARPVSARRRHRQALCRQAHRAGGRSRPRDPADRRARAQSRPARCRHHRRARHRGASRGPRHRRRRCARALTTKCAAPTSAAARSPSICSIARC